MYLKIHGIHRSGTNYARALLEKNLEDTILTNVFGWKHGYMWEPKVWLEYHREDNKVKADYVENHHGKAPIFFPFTYSHLNSILEEDLLRYVIVIRSPFTNLPSRAIFFESRKPNTEWVFHRINEWNTMYHHWIHSCPKGKGVLVTYNLLKNHPKEAVENIGFCVSPYFFSPITKHVLPSYDDKLLFGRKQEKTTKTKTAESRSC